MSREEELRCVISDLCDQVRERDSRIAELEKEHNILRIEYGDVHDSYSHFKALSVDLEKQLAEVLAACKAKDEAFNAVLQTADEYDDNFLSLSDYKTIQKALAIQPSPAALNEYVAELEPKPNYNPKYPWRPSFAWDKCPKCFENFDFDFKCDNCGNGYQLRKGE